MKDRTFHVEASEKNKKINITGCKSQLVLEKRVSCCISLGVDHIRVRSDRKTVMVRGTF